MPTEPREPRSDRLSGLLPDHEVRRLAQQGMIHPFAEDGRAPGKISSGLQSCGYDVRLAPELLVLHRATRYADPKTLARWHYEPIRPDRSGRLILPPHAFALARTVETISLPPDVAGLVLNKSTLARAGILVHTTVLEPGWTGTITLEITNLHQVPAVLYPREGIAQVLFFRAASAPEADYPTRGGIYQNQRAITPPTVRKK